MVRFANEEWNSIYSIWLINLKKMISTKSFGKIILFWHTTNYWRLKYFVNLFKICSMYNWKLLYFIYFIVLYSLYIVLFRTLKKKTVVNNFIFAKNIYVLPACKNYMLKTFSLNKLPVDGTSAQCCLHTDPVVKYGWTSVAMFMEYNECYSSRQF